MYLSRLRLASKHVAAVSTVEKLPASYWRAYFFTYYAELFPSKAPQGCQEWRALCFSLEPLARPQWTTRSIDNSSNEQWKAVWGSLYWLHVILCREVIGIPVEIAD